MKAKARKMKLTKEAQEALDKQVREEMLRLNAEYEHSFDVILAFVLYEVEGYGRVRFKNLYNKLIDKRLELRRFYSDDKGSDDKIDIFAMDIKLKEKGIDVQAILDEILEERKDDIEELNGGKKIE